ncbi:MAG: CBS domain-containing protein [archaeon]
MPKVSEIMVSPVETIDLNATVLEAAKIMGQKRIGSLVVTESSRPVGIFAEPDLLSKVIARGLDLKTLVREVMSAPLITVNEETPIKDAILLMAQKRIRRLPVMRGTQLVGIVTGREIFDFIAFFLHSLE